jgi:ribosomal protein S18 acetylase RimI-like enzyme
MTAADIDGTLELTGRVAEERLWIGTEPGFDRENFRANWQRRTVDPKHLLLVAVDGDRIVGYLGVHPHDEYGYVLGMFIDAPYRGQGLGTKLIDEAEGWARDRGIEALHLLVFPHNERARALYLRTGFVEIERYENDVTRKDGSVWDVILMRKRLS